MSANSTPLDFDRIFGWSKIAEEQAKSEAIFDSIGDGAIVTNEKGQISKINQVGLDLFGFTEAEVINAWYPKLIEAVNDLGNKISSIELPITRALLEGKSISERASYRRKDGTLMPVQVTVSPIILDNKPIGAVEVLRDITKELEVERAKTEFISLASHQLKSPPTALNWNLEMLLDGTLGTLTKDQEDTVKVLKNITEKMIETVKALLNVSRLELGTFTIEAVPVNYVDVAKELVVEAQNQLTTKKIILTEKYDTDIPLIPADPGLAKVIIENVLSNAIKYTPEGGNVTLEIKNILVDNIKYIQIRVSDTGYGIPKAQQNKIFEKMFRADNVRSQSDGTGFGLYLLKSIVELAGGKVWFESEENKGTTFYINLPYTGMQKKEGTSHIT